MTNNHELYKFPVRDMKPRATLCYPCWNAKLIMYMFLMPQERLEVLVMRQTSFDDLAATVPTDSNNSEGQVGPVLSDQEDRNRE